MKKWISIFLCLILLAALPFSVSAVDTETRVIDNAGLLSESEELSLEDQIQSVRLQYEIDVVILTIIDLEGKSAQAYADDYYDDNGYGCGADHSGVLLLIAMDTREWYISTCGEAIYALSDYSLDVLGEEMVYFLSDERYYMAFENFVNSLPKYMIAYQQGTPLNGYVPQGREEVVYYRKTNYVANFLIALVIGAVAALVTVLVMRSKMNTAKPQKNAGNYIKNNSYRLNVHRDMFLYSRVSKTPKPQNNGDGGHGGSSVHRSSGGRSHGGRGGRF